MCKGYLFISCILRLNGYCVNGNLTWLSHILGFLVGLETLPFTSIPALSQSTIQFDIYYFFLLIRINKVYKWLETLPWLRYIVAICLLEGMSG